MTPVLEARGISMDFPGVRALDGGKLNAASLPPAMSTMRGMVLSLAEMIEGEKLT